MDVEDSHDESDSDAEEDLAEEAKLLLKRLALSQTQFSSSSDWPIHTNLVPLVEQLSSIVSEETPSSIQTMKSVVCNLLRTISGMLSTLDICASAVSLLLHT